MAHSPIMIALLCGSVVAMAMFFANGIFPPLSDAAITSTDGTAPVATVTPNNDLVWSAQVARLPKNSNGDRIFTIELLKHFQGTGIPGSTEIYLAVLGVVFNVTSGRNFYQGDEGYGCFSGMDASRAFVTGEFEGVGLTDSLEGLTLKNKRAVQDWQQFYEKHETYHRIGVLQGTYYDALGQLTPVLDAVRLAFAEADAEAEVEKTEKIKWPDCNSRWTQDEGTTTFWCSEPDARVPRNLTRPGKPSRCACVTPSEAETLKDVMDLYPGCNAAEGQCVIAQT